jgi:hypothetical protein
MATDTIDPSQVKWDEPSPPVIDASQVKWDDAEPPGKIAGSAVRGLAGGVAGIPSEVMALANPVESAARTAQPIAHAIRGALGIHDPEPPTQPTPQAESSPGLDDFVHPDKWPAAARYFADKALGTSAPTTPAERVAQSAGAGLAGAVLGPESPIGSAIAGAAGGAGQQIAAENGAGPVGQAVAGLAAGSAPSAGGAALGATTRGLVRGGSQGQAALQQRVADAATSGTNLTAGQASGSPLVQYLEGTVNKLWGGAPIGKAAEAQTEAMGSHVDQIVQSLAGGATPSPMTAGDAIVKGIGNAKTPGTAYGDMRAAEKAAYRKVDELVPPDHPIDVSNTLAKLAEYTATVPGAEATTAALIPPRIASMERNLSTDLTEEPPPVEKPLIDISGDIKAAKLGKPPAVQDTGPAPEATMGTEIPYEAASALKTKIGNVIDWGSMPADPVANGALKQIHGALKTDIGVGASKAGEDAANAVKTANALYAANQATRESLNPIIEAKGGPEAVYQAATNGTRLGATEVSQVMTAINPQQRDLVRATVLDRLGRANPGQQNGPGTAFNANTFLTNWAKIDPAAKDALFGASGTAGSLRQNLDSLTNTMGNIRSGTKLRNYSGTGEAVGHSAGLFAVWEGLKGILAGHPGALVGTAAGVAANNLLARALTSPATVAWLARSTKLPASGIPNAVNQLTQLGRSDPAARDLATYLTQAQPVARATGGKVGVSEDELVARLMTRWRAAKRETDASTKPLLSVPDSTIAAALRASGSAL